MKPEPLTVAQFAAKYPHLAQAADSSARARTRSLFVIREDLLALIECLIIAEDEGDENAIADLTRELDDVSLELDAKVDAYAWVIDELTAKAGARREIVKRLSADAKRDEVAAERMKVRLAAMLVATGVKKAGAERRVSIRTIPGKVEMLEGWEEKLPDALKRIKAEPDKKAIGALLKAGETVAGARLTDPRKGVTIR